MRIFYQSRPRLILVALALSVIFSAIWSFIYVSGEDPAYIWDYSGYWNNYWLSADYFSTSPLQAFKGLVQEIRSSDYNSSPIVLLLPFEYIFGRSREGYIFAISVSYLVPAAIASKYLASTALNEDLSGRKYIIALFLALALLYPPYWAPTLRGYPDIAGIIPLAIAGSMVLRSKPVPTFSLKAAVILGLLLWLPFLLRKWYAYSIVAFFISAIIYSLVVEFKLGASLPRAIGRVFPTYIVAGLVVLFLIFVAQSELAKRAIETDYSEIFKAYQVSPAEHFHRFLGYFGAVTLSLSAIGALSALVFGGRAPAVLFVAGNIVLTYIMFTQTQVFGPHHYLPISLWLYVLVCMGVYSIVRNMRGKVRAVTCSIVILAAAFNLYGTFYPLPEHTPIALAKLLPGAIYRLRLHNYPAYKAMLHDLTQLVGRGDRFSVFASNIVLSGDWFHVITWGQLDAHMTPTAQVDSRDGFDCRPLLSRYVVVADPIQTHLPVGTQQVITLPAERILSGKGIGAAYRRLPLIYDLGEGVTAYIFEKERNFTRAETDELLDAFFASYPQWRKRLALCRALLGAQIELGDNWGRVEPIGEDELLIHPGDHIPTSVDFMNSTWGALRLRIPKEVLSACPNANGVSVKIQHGSEPSSTLLIHPGDTLTAVLSSVVGQLKLVVDNNGDSGCDQLRVKFLSR